VGERLGRLLRYDLLIRSSITTAPELLLGEPRGEHRSGPVISLK
jgi:hypothetical protein